MHFMLLCSSPLSKYQMWAGIRLTTPSAAGSNWPAMLFMLSDVKPQLLPGLPPPPALFRRGNQRDH